MRRLPLLVLVALVALLAANHRRGGATFTARAVLAPSTRHLDGVIGVVAGLTAAQADNPDLVRQHKSARWTGTETVDGHEVDLLTYQGLTYGVDTEGTLRRLTAPSGDGGRTITITPEVAAVELPTLDRP